MYQPTARQITQANITKPLEELPEDTDLDQLERGALALLTRARHIVNFESIGTPVERAEALFYLMKRYEYERGNVIDAWPGTWDLPVKMAEVLDFVPTLA